MFELSIALKYLIPRRKQLSVSLIALMSVAVISLVVWLVIIFLSVTEGIEKNWLDKLTSLNAPLRITPTEQYYSSYYYLVDNHSASSGFACKNIAQKADSPTSDPYSLDEDAELPLGFPSPQRDSQGLIKDPVKEAYRILSEMQPKTSGLVFQDFEISGALMRLQLLRENKAVSHQDSSQRFLTQVSYLASIPDRSPAFASMVLPPTEKDLDHLFYLSSHAMEYAREDAPSLTQITSSHMAGKRLKELLTSSRIEQLNSIAPLWRLPSSLLPNKTPFYCKAARQADRITHVVMAGDASQDKVFTGKIWRENDTLYFQEDKQNPVTLFAGVPLFVEGTMRFAVDEILYSSNVKRLQDIRFKIRTRLQGTSLAGVIPWEHLQISKAAFNSSSTPQTAPWSQVEQGEDKKVKLPISQEKETGVLLAKNYRESGVMLGDRGYLSFNSTTSSSIQEQRLPIFVAGFYDPGILSVGNRCILVPPFVTQTINTSSSSFNLDRTQSNGILVWFKNVSDAEQIKLYLQQEFERAGISSYWKVSSFRDYDFAKDLLLQFQSDKYLFFLIAAIILLVACCNIISLLTLLVNDKKREIGILQAMGASTKSIAMIFGTCGMAMGVLSCLIGSFAAVLTLKHIDSIVHLLSMLQGHDAFNAAFFGDSLPNTLSPSALQFIFVLTPLLSLCAGLVPALKACRLRPSEILRSE